MGHGVAQWWKACTRALLLERLKLESQLYHFRAWAQSKLLTSLGLSFLAYKMKSFYKDLLLR